VAVAEPEAISQLLMPIYQSERSPSQSAEAEQVEVTRPRSLAQTERHHASGIFTASVEVAHQVSLVQARQESHSLAVPVVAREMQAAALDRVVREQQDKVTTVAQITALAQHWAAEEDQTRPVKHHRPLRLAATVAQERQHHSTTLQQHAQVVAAAELGLAEPQALAGRAAEQMVR